MQVSGGKPGDVPASAFPVPRIAKPVVQPGSPALPELDLPRIHDEAAPVFRPGDLAFSESLRGLVDQRFERVPPVRHGPALRRSPGADLACAVAAGEVLVGGCAVQPPDLSADPDLTIQRGPEENQCRMSGLVELAGLHTLIVGEETKTVVTRAFQQNHPGIGPALPVDRGDGHRLGKRHHLAGRIEPDPELGDRVRVEIVP